MPVKTCPFQNCVCSPVIQELQILELLKLILTAVCRNGNVTWPEQSVPVAFCTYA